MSASFVGRLSETGLFFRMSLLVSLLTSWMAHEIWMSLEPRRLKRRGVGWIPLPRDRKKTIGWFPKKPPVGKHSGKNEMRWISKQMNHHRWGSSYSWAQARFFPNYVFLIYIPRSLCWCPWITNGLSNLWESFLNSAMCRDSTVSQIRVPSQMSPFPASRVTDFSWNPISLKPPFVPGFNLQQREIKHESDGSCRFGSQSYACSQCFFEILLQGLLCNAIQGSLYWIVGGSEYLYKYAFEWWFDHPIQFPVDRRMKRMSFQCVCLCLEVLPDGQTWDDGFWFISRFPLFCGKRDMNRPVRSIQTHTKFYSFIFMISE